MPSKRGWPRTLWNTTNARAASEPFSDLFKKEISMPDSNTLCDDCGEPRSAHSQEPPHKSDKPECNGFYHFVSSEVID